MAFLDNSGDIILDAVLTDTGRYRLAKGDGSFRIAKFALGDDEINYRLYDKNNTSGSAYYDLSILQTPVLEAFTDNAAGLKSKLITISRNNLLYLPVLKLNEKESINKRFGNGSFLVASDSTIQPQMTSSNGGTGTYLEGVLKGVTVSEGNSIKIDQGLDTEEISPRNGIDADLKETQYIIEIDNRLGTICDINGTLQRASYVDDDNMASYFFSLGTDTTMVQDIGVPDTTAIDLQAGQVIRGPRGTTISFKIKSSTELQSSTFLFDQLGSTTTITETNPDLNVKYIDTNVRVVGATTGYRVDIPIRFIKNA